jgi:hypothetical protein
MARQLIIVVLLLLGLGAIHTAGTRRQLVPATSKDPYAWLGPLPSKLDDRGLEQRWERLVGQMREETRAIDVRRFVCRNPTEVGSVPMMTNVVRYVDNLPASQDDKGLADGLLEAAARGNWLARTLLFSALREADDMATGYRAVQLAEWLHRHRLGQLYADMEGIGLMADDYEGSFGHDPSRFLSTAAMHHDYIAQARIGGALTESDDPELVAAGGRMLTCAASVRSFYRAALKDATETRIGPVSRRLSGQYQRSPATGAGG